VFENFGEDADQKIYLVGRPAIVTHDDRNKFLENPHGNRATTTKCSWWNVGTKFPRKNIDKAQIVELRGEVPESCVGIGINAENEHLTRFNALSEETN
jgi:hypothetical protein